MSAEPDTRWNILRPRVVGVLFGIVLGLIILNAGAVAVVSHDNCTRVTQLESVIQQQGERGLKTLGQPGGAAYAYYHSHPSELKLAQRQLAQQIRDFTPRACSFPFS